MSNQVVIGDPDWEANSHAVGTPAIIAIGGCACSVLTTLFALGMLQVGVNRYFQKSPRFMFLFSKRLWWGVVACLWCAYTVVSVIETVRTLQENTDYRETTQQKVGQGARVIPHCEQFGGGTSGTEGELWCPFAYTDSCPNGCRVYTPLVGLWVLAVVLLIMWLHDSWMHLRTSPHYWKDQIVAGASACPLSGIAPTRVCERCRTPVSWAALEGSLYMPTREDIANLDPAFDPSSTWNSIIRTDPGRLASSNESPSARLESRQIWFDAQFWSDDPAVQTRKQLFPTPERPRKVQRKDSVQFGSPYPRAPTPKLLCAGCRAIASFDHQLVRLSPFPSLIASIFALFLGRRWMLFGFILSMILVPVMLRQCSKSLHRLAKLYFFHTWCRLIATRLEKRRTLVAEIIHWTIAARHNNLLYSPSLDNPFAPPPVREEP